MRVKTPHRRVLGAILPSLIQMIRRTDMTGLSPSANMQKHQNVLGEVYYVCTTELILVHEFQLTFRNHFSTNLMGAIHNSEDALKLSSDLFTYVFSQSESRKYQICIFVRD